MSNSTFTPAHDVQILPPATQASAAAQAPETDPLARALDLPCAVTVEIALISFTVGTLINLAVGTVVTTDAHQNEDLKLSVNGQLVGTVEIEVAGDNLAVRLTGIA